MRRNANSKECHARAPKLFCGHPYRVHRTGKVVDWRGWYTVNGIDSEEIRRLAVQDRATTFEEDIHLVESVQRGLTSRGYRPGPLVLDPKGGVNSERSSAIMQDLIRESVMANQKCRPS